ncbi:MAG: hypothetical protein OXB93_01850 [Cytophagales bacterium]|nr:hypothetical protein [Cytophagales bacterium]
MNVFKWERRLRKGFREVEKYISGDGIRDTMIAETKIFIDGNFRKQGFQGASFKRWPARKQTDRGRAILVKRGDLRDSFGSPESYVKHKTGVRIVSNLPYAKKHNEGSGTTPKRQYIGDSPVLSKAIVKAIEEDIDNIIKKSFR